MANVDRCTFNWAAHKSSVWGWGGGAEDEGYYDSKGNLMYCREKSPQIMVIIITNIFG